MRINWKTEKRKVKDLKLWPDNPRTISDKELEKLKKRINDRGFHDVIKIDTNDMVLSGNQRKKVLMEMGVEEVNVLIPSRELTEEEKRKIGLESNMQDGDWDMDGLSDFDDDLLNEVGFDDDLIKQMSGLNDASDVEVDHDRMLVLEVLPPESVTLKDRLMVSFDSLNEYKRFKKGFINGDITKDDLINLL